MFQPEVYWVALLFMVASMVCWGSWANTMKLTPGWPFQLFYWDFVVGVVLGSLIWGITLGSHGTSGLPLFHDLRHADAHHLLSAIAGGVIFNVANVLLVAAIELAGLAVAFPLGIGVALVVGVVLSYLISPRGNPWLLSIGVVLVVIAIVLAAMAYRRRDRGRRKASTRGIQISLMAGVLMGLFYPLVAHAQRGTGGLGPYAVSFVFAVGVAFCTIPVNLILMRRPLDGSAPKSAALYWNAPVHWHIWAVLGGMIWESGAILNFVASHAALIGPAVSYAIGQGATLVSAIWGVFVWREFVDAPASSRRLLPLMFFFFVMGLGAIAVAPLVGSH